jgi:hypothetical protein
MVEASEALDRLKSYLASLPAGAIKERKALVALREPCWMPFAGNCRRLMTPTE